MFASVEEGCQKLVTLGTTETLPQQSECQRYDEIYHLYASLYPLMRQAFHKLASLRNFLDEGKKEILDVSSVEFERFGRVISGIDTSKVIEALDKLPCPEASVVYEPSDPLLENCGVFEDLQNRVFGGLPIEMGYCSGHNKLLNCLEYHRNSELNIAATDAYLMVAPMTAIKDGIIDTEAVETFFVPKGTAVLFYETTLHYAPCHKDEKDGFRVCVVLPKGTNTARPQTLEKDEEVGCLTHNNKWLYAHKDSPEGKSHMTHGLLIGKNLSL